MADKELVQKLLQVMEEVKPPIKDVHQLLTNDFIQKHTKFQSFQELVQTAIKESGWMDEYFEKIKNKLVQ